MTPKPTAVALLALLAASCVTDRLRLAALPLQEDEVVVGPAEGIVKSFLLLQVIPLDWSKGFTGAYAAALKSTNATRLIDVTIWESWAYAVIGNAYVFHVEGTAVRKKAG